MLTLPFKQKYMNGFMPGGKEAGRTRRKDDFYPTPPEGFECFLRAEGDILRGFGTVWENACGDGVGCRVMQAHGLQTVATDLIDRGYGQGSRDFLTESERLANAIATNPPYKARLPERFVRHARTLGVAYIALLLKADYWNAQGRTGFWAELPPRRIYPISFRLDFTGEGGGPMNCSWNVWDWRDGRTDLPCQMMPPLPKPRDLSTGSLFADGDAA